MPADIQSLLAMLQGQGQGQPQGLALSGQAFPTPLSGMPFGDQGMGMSGGGSVSGAAGATPAPQSGGGGEGMDPLMLQQLMSAIQMAGAGGSLMGGAGGGSLGQYGGGGGGFGGGGGYQTAGPTTQQSGTQAGGQAGGMDIKSALGQLPRLARMGSNLLGGTDLGTRGYVGGPDQLQGANQSLSDVVRGGVGGGAGEVAPSLQALQGGAPATDITGQFSPEIMALFGQGLGASAIPAELGGIGAPVGLGVAGGGAGAAEAGAAGAGASGAATGAGLGLGATLGIVGGPLLAALPAIISSIAGHFEGEYAHKRGQAYGGLKTAFGDFDKGLQTSMFQGPEAVQQYLNTALPQYGLGSVDPTTGQTDIGISSAMHPYINQRSAVQGQQSVANEIQKVLAESGQLQQLDPATRQSLLQNLQQQWANQAMLRYTPLPHATWQQAAGSF